MNEDLKKEIATFRFSVISDLTVGVHLDKGELESLIKAKVEREWKIPSSAQTRISATTIRRWIMFYKESNGDICSLYPKERGDKGNSRTIDKETGLALLHLKSKYPKMMVPDLIHQMEKRQLVSLGKTLNFSTVYRFLHQNGGLNQPSTKTDRRRYEAEFPNDIWQADVMHGPKIKLDGKPKKTYLIAFIDDHSRLVPHAAFYLNERLESFLDAFRTALLSRGIPRKLYTDNGSAFRSKHLGFIAASLQVSLVHSKPYVPEGRGKIERFFKTVRGGFLSGITTVSLNELNDSFSKWLRDRYLQAIHSSTGETPLQRFTKNMKLIRTAPEKLEDHFRTVVTRTVTNDRIVYLDGDLFEAPVELIGERVELLHHPGGPGRVEVRFKGESYGYLELLNMRVNAKVRRDKGTGKARLEGSLKNSPPKNGQLFNPDRYDSQDDSDIDSIIF